MVKQVIKSRESQQSSNNNKKKFEVGNYNSNVVASTGGLPCLSNLEMEEALGSLYPADAPCHLGSVIIRKQAG